MTPVAGGTISRQPGVVEAQFDEIRVVLNEDLAYLGLDEVGQRIWDLLEEPRSLDGVVGALLEEYDVDRATCERDVAAFITALEEHKLVTRG
jgi:hypothetical protein